MGTPSTRSSAGTVSWSLLFSGVFAWGPRTVSTILSGILLWNLFSSSSESLPCTRSGLSAEAGEPPANRKYPRRPSPENANTATTSAASLLWYAVLCFFIVLDLLSRSDTMVDSRTLSPICDIPITKRGFVGNGWPSGAQILLRRYNLARESWNTAGGGRGRAQGRARARDRRQARQGWFRGPRGVGRGARLQPRRELRGSGGKDRRRPSWRLRRSRHGSQGTKPDGGRDRSPAREPGPYLFPERAAGARARREARRSGRDCLLERGYSTHQRGAGDGRSFLDGL